MKVQEARYHDQMVGFVPELELPNDVDNLFATQAVAIFVTTRDREPQHVLVAEAMLDHQLLYPIHKKIEDERDKTEWLGHVHNVLRQWLPDRVITIKPYEKQDNLHDA